MREKFNSEIEFLRSLSPDDLYEEFHRIQHAILAPMGEDYIKQIVKD